MRAPDPTTETPDPVAAAALDDVEEALVLRHGPRLQDDERVRVEARTGLDAAYLRVLVGGDERAYEFELFCRERAGELFDGALGVLVDYLDGVLEEWLAKERDAWLSLDWEGRPYDDTVVYARGELRDHLAEGMADEWLKRGGGLEPH